MFSRFAIFIIAYLYCVVLRLLFLFCSNRRMINTSMMMMMMMMWCELYVALPDGKLPSCLVCEATSKERCEATGVMTECPFNTEVLEPTTPSDTLTFDFLSTHAYSWSHCRSHWAELARGVSLSLAHATAAGIRGAAAGRTLAIAISSSEEEQSTQCGSRRVGLGPKMMLHIRHLVK